MFYITASNDALWNKRNVIYNTEDCGIHFDFDELAEFSSSSSKLIELAFSLNNGYKADVLITFSCLDEQKIDFVIATLHMRFNPG